MTPGSRVAAPVVVGSAMYPHGTHERYPNMVDSQNTILSQTAHEYMECSNKGICDRAVVSTCSFDGYLCMFACLPLTVRWSRRAPVRVSRATTARPASALPARPPAALSAAATASARRSRTLPSTTTTTLTTSGTNIPPWAACVIQASKGQTARC